MKRLNKHAIIAGGGFVGLLAGRVMADYFEKVTIIERDSKSEVGNLRNPRKGVPQGAIYHHLFIKGAEIINDLYPEFDGIIQQNGAHKVDILSEIKFFKLGWKPTIKNYHRFTYLLSRSCLEETLRDLTHRLPNINFIYGTEVQGLLVNFKENYATGLRLKDLAEKKEFNLYGDLIVDASGGQSHFAEWLEALGYPPVPKQEVKIDISYFCRIYRIPEALKPANKMTVIYTKNGNYAVLNQIENDAEGERWMSTLAGQIEDLKLNTDAAYLKFASELGQQDIAKILEKSTPLSDFTSFKFSKIVRHNYEKCDKKPGHFIAIGDALCKWNPSGAIGLNVCALSVEILHSVLRESQSMDLNQLTAEYFRRTGSLFDDIWKVSVEGVYSRYEEKPSLKNRFIRKYINTLLEISNTDSSLWKTIYEVIISDKRPTVLLKPEILLKVIKFKLLG